MRHHPVKTALLLIAINISLITPSLAQEPFQPSTEQLEYLKNIIPAFPENPPMGKWTSKFQTKYVISKHKPGLFKYYLFAPEHIKEGEKLPVILLLHGGARHMYGAASFLQNNLDKEYRAILIVPIAPPGYDWNSAAPLALDALQDAAKLYKFDPKRIYVSGYSMGGIGTFSLLARYHGIFAGAFAVCGTYDPELAHGFDDIPLLIFHAGADETFPAQITRRIHANLQNLGRNSKYIEAKDAHHSDCLHTYERAPYWDWLLKQRK